MKLRNGRGRKMRTRKIQKQAFAVCLAIMTAAQTMTGYGATITAGAAPDHGSWVREGQNWKYQAADGSFAKGWIHTASGWYYLDPDTGVMKNNTILISNPMVLREECIPDGSKMRKAPGISTVRMQM